MSRNPPHMDVPSIATWEAHLLRAGPGKANYHLFLAAWRCEQDRRKRKGLKLQPTVADDPEGDGSEPFVAPKPRPKSHKPFFKMTPEEKRVYAFIQRREKGKEPRPPRSPESKGRGNSVSEQFAAAWRRKQEAQ